LFLFLLVIQSKNKLKIKFDNLKNLFLAMETFDIWAFSIMTLSITVK